MKEYFGVMDSGVKNAVDRGIKLIGDDSQFRAGRILNRYLPDIKKQNELERELDREFELDVAR